MHYRFYTAIHLLLDDKERIFQRHSSLAPSLNLKSDPRPVSPRRPRDTLGGSAIAPRPLAHRWNKNSVRARGPRNGTLVRGMRCAPACAPTTLRRRSAPCDAQVRPPVRSNPLARDRTRCRDVCSRLLRLAPALAPPTTIYLIFMVVRAPARRVTTPCEARHCLGIDSSH